ncbi:uncharacterized protein LOC124387560 [Silurus meridionalis]|uniref:uncharacterized protein LOC124387560 n=1 Tax=Silurus meridionalis TaxID=175797 RepID=UPI001EEA901B|nr:uncharacterized protein LOC124387560 [Silurus meridionalis]
MINGPTRITASSSTQIDLVFTNRPERIFKSYNMLAGLSDHNLILVARKLSKKRFDYSVREREFVGIPKKRQDGFKRAVQQIKHKHNKNILPWMNTDILKLMKERDCALKNSMKSRSASAKILFTTLRNKTVKAIRKAKADFFLTIIENAKGDPKIIWNQLKKLVGRDTKRKQLLEIKINGQIINNTNKVADVFNNFFIESVSTTVQSLPSNNLYICPINNLEPIFNLGTVIQTSIVLQTIKTLKVSRTRDIFGIDMCMLKELSYTLFTPVTKIVNLSFTEAVFPSVWKSAAVVPILKNGDPLSVDNYRPISIISTVSKVAEKLISQQIITHLNTTKFSLHPMQFGFRTQHSTETANCFFIENIKHLLDKGGVVGAVFLDLKKAFDTINHKILLTKLGKFNFSSDAIKWIESYLSNRLQSVRISDYHSPPLVMTTGVPQGSILGPLLFSLYINDLPSVCADVYIQMYADDTVIYTHGKNTKQVAEKLTQSMVQVSEWLNQSCLKLNVNKTVSMFFSKSNIANNQADIYVTGEKIKSVSEFKYLGIIIDSKLTFKSQIKKVCNRVKFNIANFRFIRSNLSLQAAKMFMYSMVMPHMTYCLTTWSQANKTTLKSLESLYKQTIKIVDKKTLRYHHCAILQKHKFLSWENVIKYSNLCLLYKIIHGLSSLPLSQFVNIKNTTQLIQRLDILPGAAAPNPPPVADPQPSALPLPPQVQPTPGVFAPREPHLVPPARFSGEPELCQSFLAQCSLIFSLQPSSFSTEQAKVAYVITLLSGRALRWATAEWENQSLHCSTFTAFREELRKVFGSATPRQDAARSLLSSSQVERSVAEYAADFRTDATDSGWDCTALYDTFFRGLSAQVKDELAAHELPPGLDALIALAIRIDRRIRERRSERFTRYPDWASGSSPYSPRTTPASAASSPPQPMEITLPSKPLVKICICSGAQDFLLVAFVDSGADAEFMDLDLARQLSLEAEPLPETLQVRALDGHPLDKATYRTKPLLVTIRERHWEWLTFLVISSPHAPVMLGFPWLRKHNPRPDWSSGRVLDWGTYCQSHCLTPSSPRPVSCSPETSSDLSSVPSVYHDLGTVFSKTRASSLPPHRPYDCAIDLLPGTMPPRLGHYGRLYHL